MPAYVIADVVWHDESQHAIESENFLPVLEKFGGKFLAASSNPEVLEGDWKFRRIVILEFPTMKAFHEWYRSPEYAPMLAIRLKHATTNAVLVDSER